MTIPEALLTLSGSTAFSILVKATMLLALGLTVTRLSKHASASMRHLVLLAMFAALLALPLVIATAPQVRISVPVVSGKAAPVLTSPPDRAIETTAPAAPMTSRGWEIPSWTGISRAVWIGGAVVQLSFLALHLLRLRRIRRAGIPWLHRRELIQSLAVHCGVRRPVEVLLHEAIAAPITCGAWRPAILLPVDAQAWNEGDLRRSLVHELEHVRRNDWATQLAARAAAACYWFHPLVWAAWRRLCLEAERAADDGVLRDAESTDYAEQLVGLARRMSAAQARLALGMANRSDLSARVSALLDSNQRRGPAGIRTAVAAVAVAVLALVAIAPITAVAQTPGSENKGATSRRASALDRALYEAAETGGLADIDSLLNAGANVNGVIHGDGSPLIGAARKGQLAAVARLLDRGADPNMPVSGDGNPLIVAAAAGHREVVSLLLDRGARIDEVVPGDESALIQASANGQLDVVRLLVSRGANINARLWVDESSAHGVVGGVPGGVVSGVIDGIVGGVPGGVGPGTPGGVGPGAPGGIQRGTQGSGEWRSPLIMARKGQHKAVIEFLIGSGARD